MSVKRAISRASPRSLERRSVRGAHPVSFYLKRFNADGTKLVNTLEAFTADAVDFPVKGLFNISSPYIAAGVGASASMSIGASNFTNEWTVAASSKDAVGRSVTISNSSFTVGLSAMNILAANLSYTLSTAGDAEATGAIKKGFAGKYIDAPAGDHIFDAVLIGGDGIEYAVDTIVGGTAASSSSTTFGFEPDIVLFCSTFDLSPDARMCFGYARKKPTLEQGCVTYVDQDNVLLADSYSRTSEVFAVSMISNVDGTDLRTLTIDDITATGIDYTFGGDWATGSNNIRVIGIKLANGKAWAGLIDSPSDNSVDWDVATPGFKPGLIGIIMGAATALDASYDGGAFGMSLIVGDQSVFTNLTTKDAVGTMDNETTVGALNKSLEFNDHDKTVLHDIDTIAPTDTGWIALAADINTADPTPHKWIGIAIEGNVPT